jgi:CrcB protein
MQIVLMVAIGGALGSIMRYLFVKLASDIFGPAFPYGTLGVNVLGGLVAGTLYVLLNERYAVAPEWRALVIVGVMGGFTTFSAFSVDTLKLMEDSGLGLATVNVLANVATSLLACGTGIWIARQWA